MHENLENLKELAETQYITLKDQLMNIINAGHGKEDELFETLIEDHELAGIRKHNVFGDSVLDTMSFTYKMASIENLSIVNGAIEKADDNDKQALEQIQVKLVALLGSKVMALEQLIALQDAYAANVENDPANEKLLEDFKMDHKRCLGSHSVFENPQETEASESLKAQTNELTDRIKNAVSSFEELSKANDDRDELFASFQGDLKSDSDRLEDFRLKLIQHLSMNIVIKENRQRYQKEQFERMLIASQDFTLKQHKSSLDDWCKSYTMLIEALIDKSPNNLSPKIQANYDNYGEATIKPLNSTIFYYFFSADKTKRTIA